MACSIYMKMDDIEGESTHANFPKWCQIHDVGFTIDNDVHKTDDDDDDDDDDDFDDDDDDVDYSGVKGLFDRGEQSKKSKKPKKPKKKDRITAQIGDVTVNKLMDLASTSIMHTCWRNSPVKKVELVFLRADGTNPGLDYFRMEMQDVTITNYTFEYTEGGLLGEVITMIPKKVQFIYKSATQKIEGKPVQRKLFVVDLVKRTSE